MGFKYKVSPLNMLGTLNQVTSASQPQQTVTNCITAGGLKFNFDIEDEEEKNFIQQIHLARYLCYTY